VDFRLTGQPTGRLLALFEVPTRPRRAAGTLSGLRFTLAPEHEVLVQIEHAG
jgi:hypothetical protein